MSQSSDVAAELQSGSTSISNEGSKSISPSIHSSDDTVVRRGDGQFKITDPKRIAHLKTANGSMSSLLREGSNQIADHDTNTNTASTYPDPAKQEENAGVVCGCNWFGRWRKSNTDGLRWV
jgi:hypothetical protein